MAYKVIKRGKAGNAQYREFQVEQRSDISSLPNGKTVGNDRAYAQSIALCEEDFSIWVLSVDGVTWKEMK